VILELSRNEVGEVAKRLGGVKDLVELACDRVGHPDRGLTFFMTP
jgi:hypothetical protein